MSTGLRLLFDHCILQQERATFQQRAGKDTVITDDDHSRGTPPTNSFVLNLSGVRD